MNQLSQVHEVSYPKTGDIKEAIPSFHSLSLRLSQFEDALKNGIAGRRVSVENDIDFFLKRKQRLLVLDGKIKSGEIPRRIVHNDTKINNVLFENAKAIAVIDLDTVGPGSILFDYGDALRTIACSSAEDEENTDLVNFDLENFQEFSRGYFYKISSIITKTEKQFMPLAPKLMTYIIGLRFLTDYLNGDSYYKTTKPNHNLIRSRVQQKLILDIELNMNAIQQFIDGL